MQYEGVVDVFQTVRTLRTQRPAMVQTEVTLTFYIEFSIQKIATLNCALQDQYQFCYRAALEYLSSFDHYTDNWQSGHSSALFSLTSCFLPSDIFWYNLFWCLLMLIMVLPNLPTLFSYSLCSLPHVFTSNPIAGLELGVWRNYVILRIFGTNSRHMVPTPPFVSVLMVRLGCSSSDFNFQCRSSQPARVTAHAPEPRPFPSCTLFHPSGSSYWTSFAPASAAPTLLHNRSVSMVMASNGSLGPLLLPDHALQVAATALHTCHPSQEAGAVGVAEKVEVEEVSTGGGRPVGACSQWGTLPSRAFSSLIN